MHSINVGKFLSLRQFQEALLDLREASRLCPESREIERLLTRVSEECCAFGQIHQQGRRLGELRLPQRQSSTRDRLRGAEAMEYDTRYPAPKVDAQPDLKKPKSLPVFESKESTSKSKLPTIADGEDFEGFPDEWQDRVSEIDSSSPIHTQCKEETDTERVGAIARVTFSLASTAIEVESDPEDDLPSLGELSLNGNEISFSRVTAGLYVKSAVHQYPLSSYRAITFLRLMQFNSISAQMRMERMTSMVTWRMRVPTKVPYLHCHHPLKAPSASSQVHFIPQ